MNKKHALLFLFLFFFKCSFAQEPSDSLSLKSSEELIFEIDNLINDSRVTLETDENSGSKKLSDDIKATNRKNCEKLTKMTKLLRVKLNNDYGQIENIRYMIEPFIVSLEKCVASLQGLTSHQTMYQANDKDMYESAFLFKELAKGNLFRVVGERKVKPKLFTLFLSLGYHSNPMLNTLDETYGNSVWRSPQYKNRSDLFYTIGINYHIAEKILLGMRFQSLPSASIKSSIDIDSIGLSDYASENFSGQAIGIYSAYIFKQHRPNGTGLEITGGISLQLNTFQLERELNAVVYTTSYGYFYDSSSEGTVTIQTDYPIKEDILEKNTYRSLTIGIHASADYFFNKLISMSGTLEQYHDLGSNIEQLTFHNRVLPAYRLRLSSFTFRMGMEFHF